MNYLKPHIESIFIECTALKANLHVLDSFISVRHDILTKQFPFPNKSLITMISTYRDLSQLDEGSNLYDTNVEYHLSSDNLSSETERILSYVSCLTITQIFEVFESFLKNVLAELISQNPCLFFKLGLENNSIDFDHIRTQLFKIQGKSNKGFIKALRKISPFFREFEQHNIWERNMSHWFELIARVRDLVVHSRLKINTDFKDYISEIHRKKLFDLHFKITGIEPNEKIQLTPYQASSIIDYMFEYAHLIYKSLSIDYNIPLDFKFTKVSITDI